MGTVNNESDQKSQESKTKFDTNLNNLDNSNTRYLKKLEQAFNYKCGKDRIEERKGFFKCYSEILKRNKELARQKRLRYYMIDDFINVDQKEPEEVPDIIKQISGTSPGYRTAKRRRRLARRDNNNRNQQQYLIESDSSSTSTESDGSTSNDDEEGKNRIKNEGSTDNIQDNDNIDCAIHTVDVLQPSQTRLAAELGTNQLNQLRTLRYPELSKIFEVHEARQALLKQNQDQGALNLDGNSLSTSNRSDMKNLGGSNLSSDLSSVTLPIHVAGEGAMLQENNNLEQNFNNNTNSTAMIQNPNPLGLNPGPGRLIDDDNVLLQFAQGGLGRKDVGYLNTRREQFYQTFQERNALERTKNKIEDAKESVKNEIKLLMENEVNSMMPQYKLMGESDNMGQQKLGNNNTDSPGPVPFNQQQQIQSELQSSVDRIINMTNPKNFIDPTTPKPYQFPNKLNYLLDSARTDRVKRAYWNNLQEQAISLAKEGFLTMEDKIRYLKRVEKEEKQKLRQEVQRRKEEQEQKLLDSQQRMNRQNDMEKDGDSSNSSSSSNCGEGYSESIKNLDDFIQQSNNINYKSNTLTNSKVQERQHGNSILQNHSIVASGQNGNAPLLSKSVIHHPFVKMKHLHHSPAVPAIYQKFDALKVMNQNSLNAQVGLPQNQNLTTSDANANLIGEQTALNHEYWNKTWHRKHHFNDNTHHHLQGSNSNTSNSTINKNLNLNPHSLGFNMLIQNQQQDLAERSGLPGQGHLVFNNYGNNVGFPDRDLPSVVPGQGPGLGIGSTGPAIKIDPMQQDYSQPLTNQNAAASASKQLSIPAGISLENVNLPLNSLQLGLGQHLSGPTMQGGNVSYPQQTSSSHHNHTHQQQMISDQRYYLENANHDVPIANFLKDVKHMEKHHISNKKHLGHVISTNREEAAKLVYNPQSRSVEFSGPSLLTMGNNANSQQTDSIQDFVHKKMQHRIDSDNHQNASRPETLYRDVKAKSYATYPLNFQEHLQANYLQKITPFTTEVANPINNFKLRSYFGDDQDDTNLNTANSKVCGISMNNVKKSDSNQNRLNNKLIGSLSLSSSNKDRTFMENGYGPDGENGTMGGLPVNMFEGRPMGYNQGI